MNWNWPMGSCVAARLDHPRVREQAEPSSEMRREAVDVIERARVYDKPGDGWQGTPTIFGYEALRDAVAAALEAVAARVRDEERERCAGTLCRYCARGIPVAPELTYDAGWSHTVTVESTRKGSGGEGLAWYKRDGVEMYRYAPCAAAAIRGEAERDRPGEPR
jgi:hypothetical protein